MSVGVRVGSIVDEVGASSFFNAFFSTITALLEQNKPSLRFPQISISFYKGKVEVENIEKAVNELREIKQEFAKYPPSSVVWDLEDRTKQPPWGKNISPDITSMENYFVSSTGRDLFDLLLEAFEYAEKKSLPVSIEEI
ncbi:MAG: Imm70 family immunity protein [Proteobacteria bacterium]|nr:Imm70 family immunity protein [Pseudomonadota bacterium]